MAEAKATELMEKIVSLCKRRGLIFQSSEIYGGINGFWDYGPLGAELKRNVKDYWWRCMTQQRNDIVGLDATIVMHPKVWEASGHTSTFGDLMRECPITKKRVRADQVEPQSGTAYTYQKACERKYLEELLINCPSEKERNQRINQFFSGIEFGLHEKLINARHSIVSDPISILLGEGKPVESARKKAKEYYRGKGLEDPFLYGESPGSKIIDSVDYHPESGAMLGVAREFNLMFKTYVGPVESEDNVAYLRPETAQAIFVQFKNVLESSRQKVPFGICQVGKAFRNEINPRNFTFRSREFEQMEVEFFIRPDEVVEKIAGSVQKVDDSTTLDEPQPNWGWEAWHKYWVDQRIQWYASIGLPIENLHVRHQEKNELAHYARATADIEFDFPFGTQELEGIAARSDYDLSQHQKHSGKSQIYFDEEAKEKYVPHVIEPSAGVDRLVLALICNAYDEDEAPNEKGTMEKRVVLRFHPRIAPYKVGVFPLVKNKPEIVAKAREVQKLLMPHMSVFYDESGAIGRRYRRQDEIGTPFCVTVDFDTLGEKPELLDTVTLRDRDTMEQQRIPISELTETLLSKIR